MPARPPVAQPYRLTGLDPILHLVNRDFTAIRSGGNWSAISPTFPLGGLHTWRLATSSTATPRRLATDRRDPAAQGAPGGSTPVVVSAPLKRRVPGSLLPRAGSGRSARLGRRGA